jgi:hypothetical protein
VTTIALKRELIKAIDGIEDSKFLAAVYTIINEKSREEAYDLTNAQWKEVERRRKAYKSGQRKTYTLAETKKMMLATLKK